MFEDLLPSTVPRQHSRLGALLGVSMAIHVIAVAALVVHGYWSIHKLPPPTRELAILMAPPPPPPPPPPPASKKKPPRVDKPVKRLIKVVDLTQPMVAKPRDPSVAIEIVDQDEGVEGGVEGGVAGGMIGGLVGGMLETMPGGIIDRPPPSRPPPPPPAVTRPAVMPRQVVEQQRVAGQTRIEPDFAVKTAMARDGTDRLVFASRMCLDTHGRVVDVSVITGSGYPSYDRKIVKTMRTWRYQPFVINGSPTPVCTSVTFIYKQR